MAKEFSSFKIKYIDSSCFLVVFCIFLCHTASNVCPSRGPRVAVQVCLYLIIFLALEISSILMESVMHMRSWFSLNILLFVISIFILGAPNERMSWYHCCPDVLFIDAERTHKPQEQRSCLVTKYVLMESFWEYVTRLKSFLRLLRTFCICTKSEKSR